MAIRHASPVALLVGSILAGGCARPPAAADPPAPAPTPSSPAPPAPPAAPPTAGPAAHPILTSRAELSSHVGRVVTLEGEVSEAKVATLLGVDVDADASGLRGRRARATGVLERSIVTEQELEERIAREGQVAHRGAGTFYRLVAIDGSGLARARLAD